MYIICIYIFNFTTIEVQRQQIFKFYWQRNTYKVSSVVCIIFPTKYCYIMLIFLSKKQ